MLQQIQNVWTIMSSVNLFPGVIILCLGAYYIAKDKMNLDVKHATLVPLALSMIGQVSFSWPKDMQDVFMDMTMGLVNAFIAIGLYSAADKYGLVDKLGKRAGKVIDGGDAPAGQEPPK